MKIHLHSLCRWGVVLRAEIKVIDTTYADILDADVDLRDWKPADPECFYLDLMVGVGPAGEDALEWFDVYVCTPRWLLEQEQRGKGYLWPQGRLLMWRYDYELMTAAIRQMVSRFDAPDWESLAVSLSRYMHWEFTDYQPVPPWLRT